MSENKRYTYNPYELWIIDNKEDKEYYSIEEVADLLNEQDERIKELQQTINIIAKDYEESYGMNIRNAEWFTAW